MDAARDAPRSAACGERITALIQAILLLRSGVARPRTLHWRRSFGARSSSESSSD